MNRLETLQKMTELEKRKATLQKARLEMMNQYHQKTEIMIDIITNSYQKEYDNEGYIQVDNTLFKEYLTHEINKLEKQIMKYMNDLIAIEE